MVCGSSSHALLYLAVQQKQLLLEGTTYMLEYGLHCFSDLCIIKKKIHKLLKASMKSVSEKLKNFLL